MTDVDTPYLGDESVNSAAEEFFKSFNIEDAEKSSSEDKKTQDDPKQAPERSDTKTEAADESPVAEGEAEETEGEDKAEPAKKYAEDDVYFKVKVGDDEHEVSAKDLRRLYGQEAALTQRSQAVAEQRKQVEAEAQKAQTVLQKMLKSAEERAAHYRNINIWQAAKELSPEELNHLQRGAEQAFAEEKFLKEELGQYMQEQQQKAAEAVRTAAQEAIKQLKDPASPVYIEDWGDKVYNELIDFGVKNGLAKEVMQNLTDAPVFKLLHKAMLYDKGSQRVVPTKKVDKEPKRIVKTTKSPDPKVGVDDNVKKATTRFRRSGSVDDAAELFMSRWSNMEGPSD